MKKTTLYIKGMHCPSCEVLVKDKLKKIKGVTDVEADFRRKKAEVFYSGKFGEREIETFNHLIKSFGYQVVNREEIEEETEPLFKKLVDAGAVAIFLFVGFFFAQEFNLIPKYDVSSGLTLTAVFILGLVASTSTCMATSGMLFLTTIGKLSKSEIRNSKLETNSNDQNRFENSKLKNSKIVSKFDIRASDLSSAVLFNLGRVLSYGFFGFVFGFLGKTIAFSFQLSSWLSLVVASAMILVGLDMLKLISFSSLSLSKITGGLFEKLEEKLLKNPKKTVFFLGAITYLLPCGFTQTVQLYALGLADPVKSAVTMMVFALGTAPALITIGFVSSLTKNRSFLFFQKVMAVLIVIIGFYYLGNFFVLKGINVNVFNWFNNQKQVYDDPNVKLENGYQVIRMKVNSSGYQPNLFTIKKNIPVRWLINGEDVYGCQGYFVVPSLGIQENLKPGENKIEFTPRETGTINFSCGMGMFRGQIEVI